VSERDLSPEEMAALEELSDLAENDPDRFRELVNEVEQQEHGESVLGMVQNAAQHRQEQDRELLGRLFGGDAA
jgi:hypothetical protein